MDSCDSQKCTINHNFLIANPIQTKGPQSAPTCLHQIVDQHRSREKIAKLDHKQVSKMFFRNVCFIRLYKGKLFTNEVPQWAYLWSGCILRNICSGIILILKMKILKKHLTSNNLLAGKL